MYLVVIAWLYVVVLMAVAEAASPNGSLLGAAITLLLYGLLPLSIVVYILGTPGRRRKIHAREMHERAMAAERAGAPAPTASAAAASAAAASAAAASAAAASAAAASAAAQVSSEPDAGGHAPGAAGAPIAPVREES